MTQRGERRVRKVSCREMFLAHTPTPPPYDCYFCHKPVELIDLYIHHHDEDKENSTYENLKPCHPGCHVRHHNRSTRPWNHANTEEIRRRKSERMTGRKQTPEHIARVVASRRANAAAQGRKW